MKKLETVICTNIYMYKDHSKPLGEAQEWKIDYAKQIGNKGKGQEIILLRLARLITQLRRVLWWPDLGCRYHETSAENW